MHHVNFIWFRVGLVSKRQFEFKLYEMASKEKREADVKPCWYIKEHFLMELDSELSQSPVAESQEALSSTL
jgi:hypothetical protein